MWLSVPCGLGLISGPIHRHTSEVPLHGAECGDSIGDHQLRLVVDSSLRLCLALVIRVVWCPPGVLPSKNNNLGYRRDMG